MNADKKAIRKLVFPLGIIVSCFVLQLTSLHSYLLFHSLIELFTVVISFGIFAVAWSSKSFVSNYYLLILGIGYFFVGGLDLLHVLSYKGMNIFMDHTTNLPTQLWISARYLEAFSFIGAFIILRKKSVQDQWRILLNANYIFLTYMIIVILMLLSIFYWHVFPNMYTETAGLTRFKVVSEYVIVGIFVVSIALLYKKKVLFDSSVYNLLSLALIVKVISELIFTGYINVYDFQNMLGHFLKYISFLLIYKAILEIGLMDPYRLLFYDLKKSQEEYHVVQSELQQKIRDNLIDAYEQVGYSNRKIAALLEIDKHSNYKKNKKELFAHITNVAMTSSQANVALIYKYDSKGLFSLVFGEGYHKTKMNVFGRVDSQKIAFIKKMIKEQRTISSSCEYYDIAHFNINGNLSYFVVVPFIADNSCKGFLFLGFEGNNSIASQELEFLDVFSIHVLMALEKLKVIK